MKDWIQFLMQRKKLWLLPIVVVLLLVSGIAVIASSSVVAPFIYTLF